MRIFPASPWKERTQSRLWLLSLPHSASHQMTSKEFPKPQCTFQTSRRGLDLICAILNRISGFAVSDLKIREHVFPGGYRFAVLIHKGVYLIYSGGTEDVTRIGCRSRSSIFMGFMLTKGITSGAIVSLRELEARSMVSSGFSTPHILPSSRTPI